MAAVEKDVPEGMCVVSLAMEELIGLPNYSNVRIAPQIVYRVVPDDPKAREKAFEEMGLELRDALGQQRRIILDAIKAFAKQGGYGDVRQAR